MKNQFDNILNKFVDTKDELIKQTQEEDEYVAQNPFSPSNVDQEQQFLNNLSSSKASE